MDLGLAGKRAIVTGGSRGIGRAIAQTLLDEGASVAICARGADGVAAAVEEMGDGAWGSACDVSNPDEYAGWIADATQQLGGLDIFIANVAAFGNATDQEARFRSTFEIDFMHGVRGCSAAMPSLAQSDAGSIVLVASIATIMADLPIEDVSYGAMKAAMVTYGSTLAQSAAADGVRVNMVSPGPIVFDGGVWGDVRESDPDTYAYVEGLTAMGRMGTPEEVAATVAFLASPASSFTTGANVRIDGGVVKTVQF